MENILFFFQYRLIFILIFLIIYFGKQGSRPLKHSAALLPGVGKTKEVGFTGWIITSHATRPQNSRKNTLQALENKWVISKSHHSWLWSSWFVCVCVCARSHPKPVQLCLAAEITIFIDINWSHLWCLDTQPSEDHRCWLKSRCCCISQQQPLSKTLNPGGAAVLSHCSH